MKKIVPYIVLILCALLLWDLLFSFGDATFHIDGDTVDGPVGAALALLFGAGGAILCVVVAVVVGVVLAVVFAGVGVVLLAALGVAGVAVAAAIVPFMLPLLALVLVWYLVQRSRKNRVVHAQPV